MRNRIGVDVAHMSDRVRSGVLPWVLVSPDSGVRLLVVRREVWSATSVVDRPGACHEECPTTGCVVRARIVSRGHQDRRDPAPGNRRRRVAAAGHRAGAGLGELAVVGRVPAVAGLHDRPQRPAPGSDPGRVGRRRAARDLLLRRRPGTQTRIRRRRPAGTPPCGVAGARRGRRDDHARGAVHGDQPGHRGRRPAGVGDPHRHRHRLRPSGSRGDQHPSAGRAADVPADSRGGR